MCELTLQALLDSRIRSLPEGAPVLRRPIQVITALIFAAVGLLTAEAQTVSSCLVGPIRPSDGDAFANFGHSFAADGNRIVVGAWSDDDLGSDSGSAYVFRLEGETWVEEAKLLASDGIPNDLFGADVAISGDLIVVGSYGGISLGSVRGAAYVFRFDGTNWVEEQILAPLVSEFDDLYGWSVAVNGERILVGDPRNPFGSSDPGRVYVYERPLLTWVTVETISAPNPAVNDRFGWSLDLQADRALIGAPETPLGPTVQTGAAFVFEAAGGGPWAGEQLPSTMNAAFDRFGEAVAWVTDPGNDDQVAVGAIQFDSSSGATGSGSVTILAESMGVWTEIEFWTPVESGDTRFGEKLAAADGAILAAGVGSGGFGFVEGSRLSGGVWISDQRLMQPGGFASEEFGADIALAADMAVVGVTGNDFQGVDSGAAWSYAFGLSTPSFIRGDANSDSGVDLGDAIWLLNFVFQGGAAPPCEKAGDTNGDQILDVGDAIFLISFIFSDGVDPPAPYPSCGVDVAPSPLCCLQSSSCP